MRGLGNERRNELQAAVASGGSTNRLRRILASLMLLGALLSGCSSASNSSSAADRGAASPAASTSSAPAAKSSKAASANAADAKEAADTNAQVAAADKDAATAAGSAPPAPAAGITPPIAADNGQGFNRKLIYKANLVMKVADYGDAQTKLRDLAALSGAFILQFTETTNDRERSGNYTIKVAAQGFSSFLDGLEKISPSLQRSVQGQDVTEEYVDLNARLKAKQTVEARLLAFMEKAQKTDDLVTFSSELSKVQTEIEQIKGRMRYLDQNVALSTIELRLYQKLSSTIGTTKTGDPSFRDRLEKTTSDSWKMLGQVMQWLVIALAAVFPLLILCAIGIALFLVAKKLRNRKLQEVRAELKRENPSTAPPLQPSDDENKK